MRGRRRFERRWQRDAVLERLDIENVLLYSVIGVLIENWDGYHNNLFLYKSLTPAGRWKVIPWDLDQVFEPCCFDFPITWPLDGRPLPGGSYNRSRQAGPISRPFHLQPDLDEAYRESLRQHIRPGGAFTVESVTPKIDEIEAFLLEDLVLLEAQEGRERTARRAQIQNAYRAMRQYLERRIPYLRGVLGN